MQISQARSLAQEALDYRSIRQDLIAGNLANVDTPFYKAKDISFESMLAQKRSQHLNQGRSNELDMAKTTSGHMDKAREFDQNSPTLFHRDGHMARNDGNSVDLDTETSEMSKNGMMYNALLTALKKDKAIFNSIITASKSI